MQRTTMVTLAVLRIVLVVPAGPIATVNAQGSPLPNCTGWSNCNPGRTVCTFESAPVYIGPTVVSNAADGLSSDGRGPYSAGRDAVRNSIVVLGGMGLSFRDALTGEDPRTLTVNLNNPVPGGGGVPLGIVTVRGDNQLYVQWQRVGNLSRSLVHIPVGQTVTAGQLNVSFHLNGRFHVLQMGPQALGHCHQRDDSTLVHGTGTSVATIYRASSSRWVVDLPAGSVGRLFDASHTVQHAVDKGLYRIRMHYELVDALPGVAWVLRSIAESQGGAGVVARYRALKRDSAQAYVFSAGELNSPGFWLLDNKRPQEALLVFRLSVEEYPDAAASHEGLGESYLSIGDTARSILSYRQSLLLNPNNKSVEDVLKRLTAKP